MSTEAAGLVRVFSPDTETELDAIVEMLEARAVPCFVSHTRAVSGRVTKGRAILVPELQLPEAVKLIAELRRSRDVHLGRVRPVWHLLSALGKFFAPRS